jgi:peptidoglycan hydrolase-like protein with peptidoglycan-binding domain
MRFAQLALLSSLVIGPAVPAVASGHARRSTTPSKAFTKRTAAKPKMSSQRTIDDERATQLQAALIKSGYLTGQPSGHWDAQSEAAMAKLQADNGWQTKLVPDSRAIIKLGLGPKTASADLQGTQDAAAVLGPSAVVQQ